MMPAWPMTYIYWIVQSQSTPQGANGSRGLGTPVWPLQRPKVIEFPGQFLGSQPTWGSLNLCGQVVFHLQQRRCCRRAATEFSSCTHV